MIVKTEAVVLKSMKYSESSLIVTFYTKQFGKLSGLVKGARRNKSNYGASLQPMSYVSLVLYKKETRELQTITQCDSITSMRCVAEDIAKIAVGLPIIELVAMIAHEEERNEPLFALVVESLHALNESKANPQNVLSYFELKLAFILGFEPQFGSCVMCGEFVEAEKGREVLYHLARGGPICRRCPTGTHATYALSAQNYDQIRSIYKSDTALRSMVHSVPGASAPDVQHFLWAFLHQHASGIRPLRSSKVFSQFSTEA